MKILKNIDDKKPDFISLTNNTLLSAKLRWI